MNITHNGKLYLFKKDDNQSKDIYYDRCWFIARQETKNEEDNILNKQLSDIYINMKYLGCRYSKDIENKIIL